MRPRHEASEIMNLASLNLSRLVASMRPRHEASEITRKSSPRRNPE